MYSVLTDKQMSGKQLGTTSIQLMPHRKLKRKEDQRVDVSTLLSRRNKIIREAADGGRGLGRRGGRGRGAELGVGGYGEDVQRVRTVVCRSVG